MADERVPTQGLVMTGQLRSMKPVQETNKQTGEVYAKLRMVLDVGEDFMRFVDAKEGSPAAAAMQREYSSKVGQIVAVRVWSRFALNFGGVA